MGYVYGINQCREVLINLSSDLNYEKRMVKVFSEIGVIQQRDVSKDHFNQIKELKNKYYSLSMYAIDNTGSLKEINMEKELMYISTEIVNLCVEIIEHNSKIKNYKEE